MVVPPQDRLGDITVGICNHGLPCCAHGCIGIRITGSPNVMVNGRAASRAPMDLAVHTCPHCGINMCICGSGNVFINSLMAHRLGDCETEFCGSGISVTGSPNVITNG